MGCLYEPITKLKGHGGIHAYLQTSMRVHRNVQRQFMPGVNRRDVLSIRDWRRALTAGAARYHETYRQHWISARDKQVSIFLYVFELSSFAFCAEWLREMFVLVSLSELVELKEVDLSITKSQYS